MYYLLELKPMVDPMPYSVRLSGPQSVLDIGSARWGIGQILNLDKNITIELDLWEYEPGYNGLPEFFDYPVLLFRNDFLDFLLNLGVDNLQVFPANLRKPDIEDGSFTNYFGVNIIGKIACADFNKSDFIDVTGTGLFATSFKNLVIDETKIQRLSIFRLAESLSSIIINEKIYNEIAKSSFRYIRMKRLS